jgi:hypothetical protein
VGSYQRVTPQSRAEGQSTRPTIAAHLTGAMTGAVALEVKTRRDQITFWFGGSQTTYGVPWTTIFHVETARGLHKLAAVQ